MPPSSLVLGLDVGTTWVRAALWRGPPVGPPLAGARLPLPPLEPWRGLPVQDVEELARAAEAALASLGLGRAAGVGPAGEGGIRVALTTQRDTLLLADFEGHPLTPLLSWRERRHLEDPEARRRLLASCPDLSRGRPLSLERWLLHRWRRGLPVPGLEGAQVEFAGGDKNCEYLALGADPGRPSRAVVSLGSAITLGVALAGRRPPPPVPGTVISPMAGSPEVSRFGGEEAGAPPARGWNVETGILSGMPGLGQAAALAGVAAWEGPIPEVPEREWVCVPWFGGALDDPEARGGVRTAGARGPDPDRLTPDRLTPDRLARAWAQGVATELARLAPSVEAVSGTRIREVRVTGGGVARGPAVWEDLLTAALARPVRVVEDPWAGCRGAVMALRSRRI
jgi:sugar (pentulose or hexulose) kinase